MTSGKSMKENIDAWVQTAKEQNEGEFDMEDLKECEELSLDKMAFKPFGNQSRGRLHSNLLKVVAIYFDDTAFKDNKIQASEWREMVEACPNCEAFSAVECGLEDIEEPQGDFEFAGFDEETDEEVTQTAALCARIQVLDLSKNELKSLAFIKGFPNLISLSVASSHLKTEEDYKPLEALENLQMLEVGEGVPDDVKAKLWAMLPNLSGLNNKDQEGNEIALDTMDFGDLEEAVAARASDSDMINFWSESRFVNHPVVVEEDFGELEEEDMDFIDDELEEEEDGEGEDEEGEEGEEGEDEEEEEGEPDAKRAKTE